MNINVKSLDSLVIEIFNDFNNIKTRLLDFRNVIKAFKVPSLSREGKKAVGISLLKDAATFTISALCGVCAWHITTFAIPAITFIITIVLACFMGLVLNIGFIVLGYPLVAWMYATLSKPKQQIQNPQYFDFSDDDAPSAIASVLPESFVEGEPDDDDTPSAIAKAISDCRKDMLEADFNLPITIDEKLTVAEITSKTNRGIKRFLHNADYILLMDICQMIKIYPASDLSREKLISFLFDNLRLLREKDQEELHIQLEAYQ